MLDPQSASIQRAETLTRLFANKRQRKLEAAEERSFRLIGRVSAPESQTNGTTCRNSLSNPTLK